MLRKLRLPSLEEGDPEFVLSAASRNPSIVELELSGDGDELSLPDGSLTRNTTLKSLGLHGLSLSTPFLA